MHSAPLGTPTTEPPAPLRSVHTPHFPRLLDQLGASLLVTTYQAGKLVIVRSEREHLNTHFRAFQAPMGLALRGDRLAIGTHWLVWEYHNVPAAAAKLEPAGRHDACFLPRSCHVTGNIQGHEMAWAGEELWLVNTRFSCLCTLDQSHSFVARWRPPFVSALAPEDRCHLNGLAIVDGRPRYATALGATDGPGGWRADKARGGVLIDVATGETIARGRSMPHSPRWYGGKLWLLESGAGSIGVVDPRSGRYESVAEFPGFTRGLDFAGPYAFVGLSQVRESAVFSGVPITERLAERTCGIWVIDIRTGQIAAFLRFEDAVQEIFAVQVVVGRRYPDLINDDQKLLDDSFVLTDEALEAVPAPLRAPIRQSSGGVPQREDSLHVLGASQGQA
ncbi:MAG: TIGR03032 family protein [Isosphaeraceae bacterium]